MKIFFALLIFMGWFGGCTAQCTTETWNACWELFDNNLTSDAWMPVYDNGTAITLCNMFLDLDACIFPDVYESCHPVTQYDYLKFYGHWEHLCRTKDEFLAYVDCFNRSRGAEEQCLAYFQTESTFVTTPAELCDLYWTLITCITDNVEAVCGADAASWQRELDRLLFETEMHSISVICDLTLTTTTAQMTTTFEQTMTTQDMTVTEINTESSSPLTSTTIPTTTIPTTSTKSQDEGSNDQLVGEDTNSGHKTVVGIGVGIGVLLGAILVAVSVLLYFKLKKHNTRGANNNQLNRVAIDVPPPIYYASDGNTLHGLPNYSSEDPMTKIRPPAYEGTPSQPSQPQMVAAAPSHPPALHINPRLQQLLDQQKPRTQAPPSVDT